ASRRLAKMDGMMTPEEFSLKTSRNFAKSLERTQYYSADRMQAYQRKLLEPLLRHARKEVPFYQTRLSPLFDNNDAVQWDAWKDIPTFTRKDAHEAGDGLFAKDYPVQMGKPIEGHSSGSTSTPFKYRTNGTMSIMSSAIGERLFDWYHINKSGKIAFILDTLDLFPYPQGGIGHEWNLEDREAEAFHLSVTESMENKLQWLLRIQADYLVTYPAIGGSLAELAIRKGHDVPFKGFFSQGEVLTKEARDKLEIEHGVTVFDRYGSSEICPISAQCPEVPGHHHQFAEVCMTETLELNRDDPIANGRGRLIVTPFYNYAMPLIRYENQDQVEVTDHPCSCGRTLPVIQRILGRERNVFIYEDGSRSWPFLNIREMERFLPAYQMQVIQKTYRDIDFLFVRNSELTQFDPDGLQTFMRERLHSSINLKVIEVDEIPRSRSGKFEAWISLVSSEKTATNS
ncbi:MAG: hypothetical protein V7703_04200, partial [Hyphomicrobiales bacterium]